MPTRIQVEPVTATECSKMRKTKHTESIFNKLDSVSDVVQAMVDGVTKKWVKVDMNSYGYVKLKTFLGWDIPGTKTCYGCAATNTLCQLMGEPFKPDEIHNRSVKVNFGISSKTIGSFERAVDCLRQGKVGEFIRALQGIESELKFIVPEASIVYTIMDITDIELLELYNRDLKKLKAYSKLAEELRKRGY